MLPKFGRILEYLCRVATKTKKTKMKKKQKNLHVIDSQTAATVLKFALKKANCNDDVVYYPVLLTECSGEWDKQGTNEFCKTLRNLPYETTPLDKYGKVYVWVGKDDSASNLVLRHVSNILTSINIQIYVVTLPDSLMGGVNQTTKYCIDDYFNTYNSHSWRKITRKEKEEGHNLPFLFNRYNNAAGSFRYIDNGELKVIGKETLVSYTKEILSNFHGSLTLGKAIMIVMDALAQGKYKMYPMTDSFVERLILENLHELGLNLPFQTVVREDKKTD